MDAGSRGNRAPLRRPGRAPRFPLGRFDLVQGGAMTVGCAEYEPGRRWSEHVGVATGVRSCNVAHLGLMLSGRNRIDPVAIGDAPYVSIRFLDADRHGAK